MTNVLMLKIYDTKVVSIKRLDQVSILLVLNVCVTRAVTHALPVQGNVFPRSERAISVFIFSFFFRGGKLHGNLCT